MRFSTKAITTCAVLAALALALSYLESFFPPSIVCLPARIVVELVGAADGYDLVTG